MLWFDPGLTLWFDPFLPHSILPLYPSCVLSGTWDTTSARYKCCLFGLRNIFFVVRPSRLRASLTRHKCNVCPDNRTLLSIRRDDSERRGSPVRHSRGPQHLSRADLAFGALPGVSLPVSS